MHQNQLRMTAMADELLDVIDASNRVVGQASREEAHRRGLPHRVAAVLLETADGALLIPSTATAKEEPGKLFPSSAGHVLSGESYLEAAARELREETGLRAPAKAFRPLGSFWMEGGRGKNRYEAFIVRYNVSLGPIVFNEEQEDELWLDRTELRHIYDQEPERMTLPLRLICQNLLGFSG